MLRSELGHHAGGVTLGFMRQRTVLVPSSVSAAARHSMMALLPEPLGPTSMMPWRTCTHAAVSTLKSLCCCMLCALPSTVPSAAASTG